jgi:hypothetical protein
MACVTVQHIEALERVHLSHTCGVLNAWTAYFLAWLWLSISLESNITTSFHSCANGHHGNFAVVLLEGKDEPYLTKILPLNLPWPIYQRKQSAHSWYTTANNGFESG